MNIRHTLYAVLTGLTLTLNVNAVSVQRDITWSMPTMRANCLPLPPEQIKGYHLYVINMFNGKVSQLGQAGATSTHRIVTLDDQTWYLFYVRAVDTAGLISKPSDVIQFNGSSTAVIIPPQPPC